MKGRKCPSKENSLECQGSHRAGRKPAMLAASALTRSSLRSNQHENLGESRGDEGAQAECQVITANFHGGKDLSYYLSPPKSWSLDGNPGKESR